MLVYLDCFSGISGDMLLGALVDAGASLNTLREGLSALRLTGYSVSADRVTDKGVSGTRIRVTLTDDAPPGHRTLRDIEALITEAHLPERASARALAIFRRLGEAEARIHGVSSEEVTFHEVGAVDSIVDIVGVALCLDALRVDEVYCSELPFTTGRVRSAHGELPVPAPATVEVLRGTAAVWRPVSAEGELVTPTGASVVATLARFERPAMTVRAAGYGFGVKQLPWANYLRVLLGKDATAAPAGEEWERDDVVMVECNLDNMTGEAMGWLGERLLSAGALDVTYTPLHMKKNRPGALLSVIARPEDASALAAIVLRESGTLGVRLRTERRLKAARREEVFESSLGAVRVKLKVVAGEVVSLAPEYEDCKALAERQGLAFERVRQQVLSEATARYQLGA